jgi:hypothetical protein
MQISQFIDTCDNINVSLLESVEHNYVHNSVACSQQANYTDRATAACRWSLCQPLRIEGVAWSAQRIPTAGAATFPFMKILNYPHEAEWTLFQTH